MVSGSRSLYHSHHTLSASCRQVRSEGSNSHQRCNIHSTLKMTQGPFGVVECSATIYPELRLHSIHKIPVLQSLSPVSARRRRGPLRRDSGLASRCDNPRHRRNNFCFF